jgi:hypothetical protein
MLEILDIGYIDITTYSERHSRRWSWSIYQNAVSGTSSLSLSLIFSRAVALGFFVQLIRWPPSLVLQLAYVGKREEEKNKWKITQNRKRKILRESFSRIILTNGEFVKIIFS